MTMKVERPKWHADTGLDVPRYDLHLITWRQSQQQDQPALLIVNSADGSVARAILEALGAVGRIRGADPTRLQSAFDSLARISVSNVGIRNTYLGTRGVPSYRTFAGSGVELGLRDADTARGALGHVMAQVSSGNSTVTAGIATAKSKYWQGRYVPLRQYEDAVAEFVSRYWFPPGDGPGRLLPNVTRGERLGEFPACDVAAIELHQAIYGEDWQLADGTRIDELEMRRGEWVERDAAEFPLVLIDSNKPSSPLWRGSQDVHGAFHDVDQPLPVSRGYGSAVSFADLLTDRPPLLYFLNGQTVFGDVVYGPQTRTVDLPRINYERSPWSGVNLQAETRATAVRHGRGMSVHESLENFVLARRIPPGAKRWILCNDGKGEIADYVIVEMSAGFQVRVGFWHAKAAGGATATVRVGDMQEVIAQAIKSRRWVTDRSIWKEFGLRLEGKSPALRFVEGHERLFRVICGLEEDHQTFSLQRRPVRIDCEIAIVQPGLDLAALERQLREEPVPLSAGQIRDLLTVWHDAVSSRGAVTLLSS